MRVVWYGLGLAATVLVHSLIAGEGEEDVAACVAPDAVSGPAVPAGQDV